MLPVPLIREVAHPFEPSAVFWKIIAGAAIASFLAVFVFAWYLASHPQVRPHTKAIVVTTCAAR